MGVPTSEVGYTPAMPEREDHEVHKEHVVALDKKKSLKIKRTLLHFDQRITNQVSMGCEEFIFSIKQSSGNEIASKALSMNGQT